VVGCVCVCVCIEGSETGVLALIIGLVVEFDFGSGGKIKFGFVCCFSLFSAKTASYLFYLFVYLFIYFIYLFIYV
jgi:hypothetical protein